MIVLIIIEVLKVALMNVIAILTMSAKLAIAGLLKITVFWNKGYGIIASMTSSNILWHDSNYIVNVVIWSKFGNSGTMKEVIII